jgi:hypothetical protein
MVALVSALSVWMMRALPAHAGHEMSGRAEPGREIAEQKAQQRFHFQLRMDTDLHGRATEGYSRTLGRKSTRTMSSHFSQRVTMIVDRLRSSITSLAASRIARPLMAE